MSVTVKTPTRRRMKVTVKDEHFSFLSVIGKQRSIFLLGCKGDERYELFRSHLSPNSLLQRVWQNLQKDMTYVLYPSITDEIYVKRENEQIERCEDFYKETKNAVVFVPVDPSDIPNGFMIVLPPPILDYENSSYSVLKDQLFVKKGTEYAWVEAFPYGKSESFNALSFLEQQYNIRKQHIHYAFIKSERKYAFTDLDTIQEAMQVAMEIYKQQGIPKNISILRSPLTSFSLLSFLTEEALYSKGFIQEVLERIDRNKRYYERFFEDDYLDIIVDLRLPTRLELIFDYDAVRKASKNFVFDCWLQEMNEFVESELNCKISKLLLEDLQIDSVYPLGNYQEELDKLLMFHWDHFVKEISGYRDSTRGMTKQVDEMEYSTAVKDVKVQLKQKLTTYVEKHLFHELEKHIQSVYGIWNEVER